MAQLLGLAVAVRSGCNNVTFALKIPNGVFADDKVDGGAPVLTDCSNASPRGAKPTQASTSFPHGAYLSGVVRREAF
jgi:hypothetical protein